MRRILLTTGLILSSQVVSLSARAVDCKVSFDQSCLSRHYDSTKVEQNHAAREQKMNAAIKEEQEKAVKAWAAAGEQVIPEQPTAAPEDQYESDRFYIRGRLPALEGTRQQMQRSGMFRSSGRR